MNRNSSGFTIIELVLAMTFFSFVMIAAISGIIFVNQLYFKTRTTVQAQSTARSILENIEQSIRSSGAIISPVSTGTTDIFGTPNEAVEFTCIGAERYTFVRGTSKMDRDVSSTGCAVDIDASDNVSLLNEALTIQDLSITSVGNASDTYQVEVFIAGGSEELLASGNGIFDGTQCSGSVEDGSQFCATARLKAIVSAR